MRGRPRAARHSCGTARCLADVCPCSCSTLLWQPAKQLCGFADANIQLRNPLHDVVGDFGGKSQSDIAGSLLDALQSLRLYVPSTFPESCKSRRVDDQATYTSKVGCVHSRIDYFLASRNVACKERSVAVDRSFDMLNDIDDHWALFGQFRIAQTSNGSFWKRRVIDYDRSQLHDPGKLASFRQFLAEAPEIPYAVEPTSHLHMLNGYVHECLVCAYGPPPKVKRNNRPPP